MNQVITIGLDAKRIVGDSTELGSYERTLVNDLAMVDGLDLRLYAADKGCNDLRLQVAEGERLHFCYPSGIYRMSFGKSLWCNRGLVSQLSGDGVAVYHGLAGELPSGLDKAGIKSVVTVSDLCFMRHPEYCDKANVKSDVRRFRQALQRANRIVAISESVKREICELAEVGSDCVDVIYQGGTLRFVSEPLPQKMWEVRDRYDLPDRYVLNIGTIEERRNVLLVVKALRRLPDDVALVIVGRPTPYMELLKQYIVENRLGERVLMLHSLPDDDLPALYRMADAFVYPSRYEGLGIPIIEAIRMGLPVVACTGSCLEEAGGPDCLYVNPDDDEEMANALQQVLIGAPDRERRVELSQSYVRRFDNTDAARKYADLYMSL